MCLCTPPSLYSSDSIAYAGTKTEKTPTASWNLRLFVFFCLDLLNYGDAKERPYTATHVKISICVVE